MAWTVDDAFKGFHAAINLSGDNRAAANKRKDWVVGRLAGKMNVLDAFTFGSIPRFTALKDRADADVLVVLHFGDHIDGRQPATVLNNLKTALGNIGTVRRNGQAITVKFESWPDLDVVPAARYRDSDGTVSHYEIPDSVRGVWIKTKPRLHAKQSRMRPPRAGSSSARSSRWRRTEVGGRPRGSRATTSKSSR